MAISFLKRELFAFMKSQSSESEVPFLGNLTFGLFMHICIVSNRKFFVNLHFSSLSVTNYFTKAGIIITKVLFCHYINIRI